MSTSNTTTNKDIKAKLSLLWIFVMFNYLYADVFGLMDSVQLKQILTGQVGDLHITQSFLLAAAVLMEIPIAMVLLSRLLEYKINRWANIIAGTIKTCVVLLSIFVDKPTLYYVFFSCIEMVTTFYIVVFAWKWRNLD